MKNILVLLLFSLVFVSCRKDNVDPDKTVAELISLNAWKLDRYSDVNGQGIANSSLNTEALLLYAMNFEFRADGEVRGLDKVSSNIIDKGVWKFLNNDTAVNVKLSTLDYDFQIITIKTGKLILQAPTGNFLSGVGDQINLEFSSVTL